MNVDMEEPKKLQKRGNFDLKEEKRPEGGSIS